ncbi:unnamed protein product, partial [Arabidopsis halleri]
MSSLSRLSLRGGGRKPKKKPIVSYPKEKKNQISKKPTSKKPRKKQILKITETWWDNENCPVPSDLPLADFYPRFRTGLRDAGLCERADMRLFVAYKDSLTESVSKEHKKHGPVGISTANNQLADYAIVRSIKKWLRKKKQAPQDVVIISGDNRFERSAKKLEAAGHRVFLLYREIKGNKVSSGALCKQVKSFRSDWRSFLKLEEIEPRRLRNDKRHQERIERFKEKKKNKKLAKEEEKKNAESNQRRITLVSSIGMEERDVVGDGNCQFRALSDQLYDDENDYNYIRQQVIEELRAHPERYLRFAELEADISYEEYLTNMARYDDN